MKDQNCPCGRELNYEACCGAIHQDIRLAKTAEDLMRSRYSAFVKAKGDYLMESQHSSTRNPTTKHDTVFWAMSVKWQELVIHEVIQGAENDEEGFVAFSAYYMEKFQNKVINEYSIFVRENGHWVYLGSQP